MVLLDRLTLEARHGRERPRAGQQFVRGLAGHANGKAKDAMGRVSFSERVERAATKDRALAADESKWDTDHFKLGTPDGTIDLKSGILAPSNSADMISKTTLVAPARTEDCPRWHSFLDEATCGDAELIRFLKQFCGYSLTGSIREHALAFVHGDGGNGKSVFINTVGAI